MADDFLITTAIADHISIAFYQNEMPLVSELAFTNSSDNDLDEVEILLESEPLFASPMRIRIDAVPAGATRHVSSVDLKLDAAYLRGLKEGVRGSIKVSARHANTLLAEISADIELLPPSHWGGTGAAPELLAAFVRPNDDAVDVILHDASARLAAAGRRSDIDGYSSGGRERSWELANAVWAAIAGHGIAYVLPPSSFERNGQKVRSPSDILERKTGTCLDLALLYAACLEQAGLNAVVVLTEGHAFTGLWLQPDDFPTVAVDDMQMLRKRRDLEELVFVETTFLTHTPPGSFSAAVKRGADLVEEDAPPLEIAIDMRRARARHIKPLDLGDKQASTIRANVEKVQTNLDIEVPPSFVTDVVIKEEPEIELDRLERWKRKLLDLSLRNKMLNFKDGKKAVGIECPEPARLEDMLAGNVRFKLFPRSDVLGDGDRRDTGLFVERHHEDGRQSYLLQALERCELYTSLTQRDLDNRLTDLFRVTRTAFEEGGSNILFLAIGFLKWAQKENGPSLRAPLLLVPVSLQRSSVRSGFRLALHDEEVRFNPTLLQMLRQDFMLQMPEFDGELPADSSGIDVAQIFRVVRTHIKDLKGWEVTPEVVLSTFSFTKFLMWRDLVERTELLKRNPVVRHLIDTPKQQYGDGSSFPAPERLDQDYHPVDIFAPLPADSSQLSAVLAAASGKDFVLFGPPGTGKSQTIANMISHCLAMGKTVLFVSQKTAALEVVQRRLRDIGLGEYCLEVHSTKAQKSAVLGQLKQAWHERSMPSGDEWASETENLALLRDELNKLVSSLHRRRSNGMSAFSAFGMVSANRDRFADLKFDWQGVEHSEADISAFRSICRELQPILDSIGDPGSHSLRGLQTVEWDPFWRQKTEKAIVAAQDGMSQVALASEALAKASGLPLPPTFAGLEMLGSLIAHLLRPEGRAGHLFLRNEATAIRHGIVDLSDLQGRADKLRVELSADYRNALFEQDLDQLLSDWTEASKSNFLVRSGRQKKVVTELQPFATSPLPADLGAELVTLIEMRRVVRAVDELEPIFEGFGKVWAGLDTNVDDLSPAIQWASHARELISTSTAGLLVAEANLLNYASRIQAEFADRLEPGGGIFVQHSLFADALSNLKQRFAELNTLAGLDGDLPVIVTDNWIDQSEAILVKWQSGLHLAQAWTQWVVLRERAEAAGLNGLIAAIELGDVKAGEIEPAFEVGYARWWGDVVVADDPILRTFLAKRHEDTIARFRAADERVTTLTQRIVRARLSGHIPAPTAFGSDPEWGTLARELQKKAKHQPLRQLFSNIPTVLTQLTPCVMMSPLSIAQYLPPDAKPFDVVIFDEASQIPVWDAIGAIARGNQVVIVGDPEQLPPTSVGERGVDDVEDGIDVEDQESILDESLASNVPPLQLNWHYRSKHESLIAFSNNAYYKGRLVTFPSPVTEDRAVRYEYIPNGVYERGAGRVNKEEARAVADEVIRRLRDPEFARLELSLGVVTFNGEQMRLIENLLEQGRRSYPEIEPFFSPSEWHEPVFVKNLENVQGDERDIIIFSVAVGPDQTGRIVATISSLNKEGGHRRLNVAITRARREMVVYTSLRPEQIDLSKTRARGVRDFKHFLEYADRGARAIAEAFAPTGGETESLFETAVKEGLENRGWVVHPQIGVSKFRIDLGIVDPDAPGRYLAGIECDGATYHSSATARDRDRIREAVLRDLGWTIHRVWSTDWWMNADSAIEVLDEALRADLETSRQEAAERKAQEEARAAEREAAEAELKPEIEDNPDGVSEDSSSEDDDDGGVDVTSQTSSSTGGASSVYAAASPQTVREADLVKPVRQEDVQYQLAVIDDLDFAPDPQAFYDPAYRPKVRAMAAHILSVEAPIYEDLLVQRIARAHGFSRAGSGIRDIVASAIGRISRTEMDDDRKLLWLSDRNPIAPISFRPSASEMRGHVDIPLCELAILAQRFVDDGGDRDEVVRRMAAEFSLGRLRSSTEARFGKAYELAIVS